ncbi:hypothetical protein PENTCL1PPCAC_20880, partial [Pristionchus entomophagus]
RLQKDERSGFRSLATLDLEKSTPLPPLPLANRATPIAIRHKLCLVNDDCSGAVSANKLVPYADEKPCKILLAIWPYSETKWRITIETSFTVSQDKSSERLMARITSTANFTSKLQGIRFCLIP